MTNISLPSWSPRRASGSSKLLGRRGATLLEFMVYIALIALVLVSAASFAYEFVQAQARAAALEEVTQNGKFALARIATEVRQASAINAGSSTFGTHPGVLSLATASAPTNPTVISVSGSTLQIAQGTGAALPLTSSRTQVSEFIIDDLTVTGRTRIVRLRLRLKYANPSNLPNLNAETLFETTARVHKGDGFGP